MGVPLRRSDAGRRGARVIFGPTPIAGVVVIDTAPARDERGSFARLHCLEAFAAAGHPFVPAQTSMARNVAAGTLRGLHWQAEPDAETKLVRVVRGRVFDVAVDVRPDSPTHRRWFGVELDAEGGRALLLGPGIAHGYVTLESETDLVYQISPAFRPGFGRGARWDDPAFGIAWPRAPVVIGERDASFPDYA